MGWVQNKRTGQWTYSNPTASGAAGTGGGGAGSSITSALGTYPVTPIDSLKAQGVNVSPEFAANWASGQNSWNREDANTAAKYGQQKDMLGQLLGGMNTLQGTKNTGVKDALGSFSGMFSNLGLGGTGGTGGAAGSGDTNTDYGTLLGKITAAGNNAGATPNTGGYDFTGSTGGLFGNIGAVGAGDTSLPSTSTGIQGQSVWNQGIADATKGRTNGLSAAIQSALKGTGVGDAAGDWANQLGTKAYQSAERQGQQGEGTNQLDIATAQSAGKLGAAQKLMDTYETMFNSQNSQQNYLNKMLAMLAGVGTSSQS